LVVKNTRTAEHYRWGQACDGWRLLDRPDLTVIQERIPSGEGEVKHFHRRSRQLFFVLDGEVQIEMNGETLTLKSGDALEVPPAQAHRVRNVASEPVLLLVISAPSTHGDREESEPLIAERRS
jgi:mannose-6-phosphate isomerase-like protein (cupin superfamily)